MSDHQSQPSTASDESQSKRTTEGDDQARRLREEDEAARRAELIARQERELLAQHKKKDLERLQIELANSSQPTIRSHKPRSPVVEKFVNLARRKKSKEGLSPTFPTVGSLATSIGNLSRTHLPEVPKMPVGIEVGGKGIVPQKDAPVSAVNAGDRVSGRLSPPSFINTDLPRRLSRSAADTTTSSWR